MLHVRGLQLLFLNGAVCLSRHPNHIALRLWYLLNVHARMMNLIDVFNLLGSIWLFE